MGKKRTLGFLEGLGEYRLRFTDEGRCNVMTEGKLIQDVRAGLVIFGCVCHLIEGSRCTTCELVEMIDDGLAMIDAGEEPDTAKTLKEKSKEQMRSGNMLAAVKLYNKAWDMERKERR